MTRRLGAVGSDENTPDGAPDTWGGGGGYFNDREEKYGDNTGSGVAMTTSWADITGFNLSLADGTWIVFCCFDIQIKNGICWGNLDVDGTPEANLATLTNTQNVDVRLTAYQVHLVTISSGPKTVKLRAKGANGSMAGYHRPHNSSILALRLA